MSKDQILYAIVVENNRNQRFSRYIILDKQIHSTNVESIILKKFNNIKKLIDIYSVENITVIF